MFDPLHHAILTNDLKRVEALKEDSHWHTRPNKEGFTAIEVAILLGRKECLHILDHPLPHQHHCPAEVPLDYAPCIRLDSYPALLQLISLCPREILQAGEKHITYQRGLSFREAIFQGQFAPCEIRWIDPVLGYGVFAKETLPPRTYISNYSGQITEIAPPSATPNSYWFRYLTKEQCRRNFIIDALPVGNEGRFINHSDQPNLERNWAFDRGLLHLIFWTQREVKKGEQLTYNYGESYWKEFSPLPI